jgi:hypothetical protein
MKTIKASMQTNNSMNECARRNGESGLRTCFTMAGGEWLAIQQAEMPPSLAERLWGIGFRLGGAPASIAWHETRARLDEDLATAISRITNRLANAGGAAEAPGAVNEYGFSSADVQEVLRDIREAALAR